jgi:predicted GNAT superfamily acetyltransferase
MRPYAYCPFLCYAHPMFFEGYELRDITNPNELELLEEVQKAAWGYDDREVTPGSLMVASVHSGGIVVAAFPVNSSTPVGFAFGFPAVRGGRLLHHSHLLAIAPAHRGTGLARELKLMQRARALEAGFDLMTWTFDPLISRNARLNLGKLGAKAVSYHADWYAIRGGIYAGLPADRFMVEWDLRRESTEHPVTRASGELALEAVNGNVNLGVNPRNLELNSDSVLIEVPRDIEALKRENLEVARAWRLAQREVFPAYFARGYVATDLASIDTRTFYVLEKT